MNEQFVNALAVALRKVGTIHTVGEEWVSYIGEIPVGGVPYCGQMVTRATYSALWSYAQAKGLVKTEAEWQQIATANNGNVPFYSTGDGKTTFRMPKISGYVKGASSQSVAGDYVAEGLPNIEGSITTKNADDATFISDASSGQISESGAFYISQWTNKYVASRAGTSLNSPVALEFNASYSNPIYGNSEHVTPETSTVMFGAYAFGAIVETGELDAPTLQTSVARVEAELSNVVRTVNGTSADANGNVEIGGDYLPLGGGEMWGGIAQSVGDFIRCEYTNKYTSIKGGINDTNGGSVTVYGKNHATNAGEAVITACNGTYTKSLVAKPDGTLTWGGGSLLRTPDYTSGVSRSKGTNYTAERDCFIVAIAKGYNATTTIYVNDVAVVKNLDGGTGNPLMTLQLFVAKGDVYRVTGDLTTTITEYPLKGAK